VDLRPRFRDEVPGGERWFLAKKASPGTALSVKEKIRNGRPVFEVMTAQAALPLRSSCTA
jgi:hypothetical protein